MDLSNKRILLTGGTSGLGLETARILISSGAEVYAMGRKLNDRISEDPGFRFIMTDFSDISRLTGTMKELLTGEIRFDLIINNAGVLSPPNYTETVNRLEYSFQVNFLSHLVINEMLLEHAAYSGELNIIVVTSPVYNHITPDFRIPERNAYKSFRVYSESKFYMLLIGDILKRDFPEVKFGFYAFNPGTFGSGIYRMQKPWFHTVYRIAAPFMRNSSNVAASLCRVAEREHKTGNGIYSRNRTKPSFISPYSREAEEFITRCSELVRGIIS